VVLEAEKEPFGGGGLEDEFTEFGRGWGVLVEPGGVVGVEV
jgi:hypothetical protein